MMKKTFFFLLALFLPFCLFAQYFHTPSLLVPYTATAPEVVSTSAVLIDADTGALLFSKAPNQEIPPASLTKLMTLHILMSEIEAGRASYDDLVTITAESWAQNQPPRSSLMFLAPGQIVTLREIMLGLAVSSGNDAAVAAALHFAPTVRDFAVTMTAQARRMGLAVTRFEEPSGISEYNMTTAAEFAHFCRQYLLLHPQSVKDFHSVPVFAYPTSDNVAEAFRDDPHTIVQFNRNSLLRTFPGVDGLKTGYIDEAGYNIAVTAQREGTRFLAVILGAPAEPRGIRIRDTDAANLLTWAFDNFKTVRTGAVQIEDARLWKGKTKTAKLKLASAPDFTSPLDRADKLFFKTFFPSPIVAPLPEDFPVGYLVISDGSGELSRTPLLTARPYEKGNIFKRFWHSIVLLFKS
jgi:D-alanyl-D-alanine carboxypeptidase (penicillin-binding protein 5/6)